MFLYGDILIFMTALPIFEKKNVLVTGGAGFVGSHLCERLLREAKVICMDDLSNGSLQNIEHLLQYPDFEFIKYDVNQPIDLDDFSELQRFKVPFQGVQEVYHLAASNNPKEYERLKIRMLRSHSDGVLHTLELAARYHAKYVLASSGVVYGPAEGAHAVFSEDDESAGDHLSARGAYNEGKRFAETCAFTYREAHRIEAKIARMFPTYGPRMPLGKGLLIPDFIVDAIDGKELVIYGEGTTERSLCYVSDMVDGLIRLMRASADVFLVNLGSDQSFTVMHIVEQIIAMTGSVSEITLLPPPVHVTRRGIPNVARAKTQLGWIPLVSLREGLRKTIDYIIAKKH